MNGRYLLQDSFDRIRKENPDIPALYYNGEVQTYEELYWNSVRVSDMLLRFGAGRGECVAIYLDKSDRTIASMFGVLYSSCSYIPLDSVTSPPCRIIDILINSGAGYIITCSRKFCELAAAKEFVKINHIKVILVDAEPILMENCFEQSWTMDWNRKPEEIYKSRQRAVDLDLAYILYTSGSTGEPKGVMISHLNALTFVNWAISYFKMDKNEKMISIAPFHFDLSVFDIYVSLSSGAGLTILSAEQERNPLNILTALSREKITVVYSVPSLWTVFLKYGKNNLENLACIKKVLFAGEIFQPKYLKMVMNQLSSAVFYNLYGLIETNVCTCQKVEKIGNNPPPIGYPCANSEIAIINTECQEAVESDVGELCVRGSIIMSGYYNNQALTEASFVTIDTGKRGKLRFYRTGDIVKRNFDGAVEYIGRKDSMIKKNGYRIELMEIEKILYQLSFIEEAIVTSITDEENGRLLCAAVIPAKNTNITVMELKKEIGKRLPEYMIPDYIKLYQQFDKSINGKIDRLKIKELFLESI